MRQFGDEWRIIDVYLKGTYSEVATKRSEYSSILRDKGVDALIRELDAKAAAFRARAN
jgi:phospholipid transport system substrate-binding protein